jgi:hypothetical protein
MLAACARSQESAGPASTATQEKAMSDEIKLPMASFDRPPPPKVPPVRRNGIRYEQHMGTHDDAIGQSGGLLDIIDDATGKLIATIKVYDNQRRPDIEGDVQDIFFTSMAFDSTGKLIIADEIGRRFAVDTATRKVTPLP